MSGWPEVYGNLARRYRGTCTVPLASDSLDGPFQCIQVHDGRIYLRLDYPSLPRKTTGIGAELFKCTGDIVGTTSRGQAFRAKADVCAGFEFRSVPAPRLAVDYMLREAVIGDADANADRHQYGLTNLVFTPSHYDASMQPMMAFGLDSEQQVIVRRLPRYQEISRIMKVQHSCVATCAAETSCGQETIDQLCQMLSLAEGSFVNWIWREDYRSNRRVRVALADRVTRPYTGLPVIPVNEPGRLPQFVSMVSDRFAEVFEGYHLNSVIRLMCEARSGQYLDLEPRAIMLAIVLEVLAAAHGVEKGISLRMPDAQYTDGQNTWKPVVRSALSAAYPGRGDLDSMINSIASSLNRTPFPQRIGAMATEFKVPAALTKRLHQVVDMRNKLIHEARFPRQERQDIVQQFFFFLEFVDCLILRLLAYSGEYMAFDGTEFVRKTLG